VIRVIYNRNHVIIKHIKERETYSRGVGGVDAWRFGVFKPPSSCVLRSSPPADGWFGGHTNPPKNIPPVFGEEPLAAVVPEKIGGAGCEGGSVPELETLTDTARPTARGLDPLLPRPPERRAAFWAL
jgi:hypothetical protein